MCDNIFNCTSLGFIYVWLCSPQASNYKQVLRIIQIAVKSDVKTGRI